MGQGGGLVVGKSASYSNDLSSIQADQANRLNHMTVRKGKINEKEAGDGSTCEKIKKYNNKSRMSLT